MQNRLLKNYYKLNNMISYEYTKINRLDNPHKYMYTPYFGVDFVSAYFQDRIKNIQRFKLQNKFIYKSNLYLHISYKSMTLLEGQLSKDNLENNAVLFKKLAHCQADVGFESNGLSTPDDRKKPLIYFSIESEVNTEILLISLIYSQLNNENSELTKKWIDRLVQRFEVTKKLYERYPSGFRKGAGSLNLVSLYWLMALSLTLFYSKTKSLKYINTLLKLSDLLCSLDDKVLLSKIPLQGLLLVLSIEVLSVKSLSINIKGASFVFE